MFLLYLTIAFSSSLTLFLVLWLRRKTPVRFVSMVFLVFLAAAGAFLADGTGSIKVAKAVDTVKSWISSPLDEGSFLESGSQSPVIKLEESIQLDVPAVSQLPELARGCEVTSLSMLLKHAGVKVDKLELADQIYKNPEQRTVVGGVIHYGHPNEGFIGNMYTHGEHGLGVYHKPIADLAGKFLPGRIRDLTGADFDELKIPLSDGRPVWIITNTRYKKLDSSEFEKWHTPQGEVMVTYREHSVLLTGYDSKYVYFNDPLTGQKNKKAPIADFKEAWVQMGRQAVTYLPL
ncbi:C39 family peptidase [Mesobacillus zeae]|uniref:Peptidase C39-like domain-containing protein n=1 Tax=Mesobacillus zeae TaxID=1917180 RepID=A0A398B5K8_9BACI|nr:C39 family peptidase [Mesobacillus zeae]RID83046.1 hypothetical protein D1970_16115 [Mesobacillus zeae]